MLHSLKLSDSRTIGVGLFLGWVLALVCTFSLSFATTLVSAPFLDHDAM